MYVKKTIEISAIIGLGTALFFLLSTFTAFAASHPTPGNSGTITTSSVASTSLTLNWTKATDDVSAQVNLEYEVRRSVNPNIDTVVNAEVFGTIIQPYTVDVDTFDVTSLQSATNYYFNVIVKDEAGNKSAYTMKNQATTSDPKNVGVSVVIGDSSPPVPDPGGGGGPTTGAVTMEGKAYPNAFMTILQNGAVASTFLANVDGTFSNTISGIMPQIYSFGIFAEDQQGRISPTLSLGLSITAGKITTVSGLFMPPTIETPTQAKEGFATVLFGTTFPNSNIFLYIEPGGILKETKANASGKWQYILSTSGLGKGFYTVRAKAITDTGEQSEFSSSVSFEILKELPPPEKPPVEPEPREGILCLNGDLNRDGVVNITDVSIWVYYLNTDDSCADQNGDGIVDIFDLSIIVFYWR